MLNDSSSADDAGIRDTGRLAGDPLGTLQPESGLKAGETTIDGSRYGDYAGEAVDPDGCTIWHFEEYARGGSVWGTWTGSFKFPSCGGTVPTATNTPTVTSTPTNTPSGTATPSNTPAVTATPTNTPTATATSIVVLTNTPTATSTPSATATKTPVSADFSLSASPTSQSVPAGGSTTYTVTITTSNGFTGQVSLSASGQPSRSTTSFSPNPATSTSTLTVNVASGTPRSTYTISITGTSGTVVHMTSVTLNVMKH